LQNNDGSNDAKRANLALKRAINRIQIAEMR
jgi:F-type H+-transporting ATPase subunit epsilon